MTAPHRTGRLPARSLDVFAAGCVALLLVGACSSSKPTSTSTIPSTSSATSGASAPSAAASSAGAAATACSLATNADVKSVYGEEFGAAQSSTPGGYSTCLFPPPTGGIDSVSFTVATGSRAQLFYTTNASVYTGQPVSGLGVKAFVSADGGAVGVLSGNSAFLVHVVGFEKVPPSTLQTMQVSFAKLLVSRLH